VTHDQVEAMTMATRIAVIRRGIIQQVDTPQSLYDHPSNVFVAGFIGSPAMNFFDAKVERSNGQLIIGSDVFNAVVPESKAPKYQDYVGKQVVFGIRPEDIHDPNFTPADVETSLVGADVDVTELMGNEIFLHLKAKDNTFVGRVDPRTSIKAGSEVQVAFNMDNMQLFETEGDQSTIM
jgi:multiple sugar transport system ATP-binding protein